MNHVMVDLETLSTKPNACILTFGAMKFDPFHDARNEKEERIFNSKSTGELIRFCTGSVPIDEGTLDWWAKQDEKENTAS